MCRCYQLPWFSQNPLLSIAADRSRTLIVARIAVTQWKHGIGAKFLVRSLVLETKQAVPCPSAGMRMVKLGQSREQGVSVQDVGMAEQLLLSCRLDVDGKVEGLSACYHFAELIAWLSRDQGRLELASSLYGYSLVPRVQTAMANHDEMWQQGTAQPAVLGCILAAL